jgi:acetolactate synthase-1/2/3 large subunit
MRVTEREQVAESVTFARAHNGPVLIEYMVQKEEIVYPMVPAGADLDKMIRRPKPNEA